MKWSNFVAQVEYADGRKVAPFTVRAVSCKHALTKTQRMHPDAQRHEVEKCRCSEFNNDMCTACYTLYTGR